MEQCKTLRLLFTQTHSLSLTFSQLDIASIPNLLRHGDYLDDDNLKWDYRMHNTESHADKSQSIKGRLHAS